MFFKSMLCIFQSTESVKNTEIFRLKFQKNKPAYNLKHMLHANT